MTPYDEALKLILDHVRPLEAETVSLERAGGRFVARKLESPTTLPPFANSAMDGFALDTGGREIPAASRWRVVGSVAAGDEGADHARNAGGGTGRGNGGATPGRAVEIMTGAPVPEGFDTVVRVEDVEVEEEGAGHPSRIRVAVPVGPGQNIRPAGKDFDVGDPVVAPGHRIDPAARAALAALGLGRIPVLPAPRAAIFPTGAELVTDPDRELAPGQIRNSNGPYLEQAMDELDLSVLTNRPMGDQEAPFLEALNEVLARDVDLVVTTGAVSMGRYDFIPRAVEEAGARILFHKAAIRPGKPVLVAVLPGGALFFGLPGNPVSVAVGFRFFVHPFIRALRRQSREVAWRLPLAESVGKRPDLRYFRAVEVVEGDDGGPAARVLPDQQSFRLSPLLAADAWCVLPEGLDEVPAGARVDVLPL